MGYAVKPGLAARLNTDGPPLSAAAKETLERLVDDVVVNGLTGKSKVETPQGAMMEYAHAAKEMCQRHAIPFRRAMGLVWQGVVHSISPI